jgi:CBS domain-containing membrane protein
MSRFSRSWFAPILLGASARDRVFGVGAAALAIATTMLAGRWLAEDWAALPFIVAPVGASAVLLFVVPTSPLTQPWPVIGGNTLSAVTGAVCAAFIVDPVTAGALAVSLAILVMSVTRSLHPPGGAMALTAVLAAEQTSLFYPAAPALLNSICMVVVSTVLHRAIGRSYPHRPASVDRNPIGTRDKPAGRRLGFDDADIDAALEQLDIAIDLSRDDLKQLIVIIESAVLARAKPELTCNDIMSRDVVFLRPEDTARAARDLMLQRGLRTIPVIDEDRGLRGTVGLREIAAIENDLSTPLSALWSEPETARAFAPALSLAPVLLSGSVHAAMIVDDNGKLDGIVSQTDLLAALMRISALSEAPSSDSTV